MKKKNVQDISSLPFLLKVSGHSKSRKLKKNLQALFEKMRFKVSYLIKQVLEHMVKSLKEVPLHLIESE